MARDYYQVLGVTRRATEREIKGAYRRLARQYHPDVTGDDGVATERFRELTEAYECLSDTRRRRTYDLFGHPQGTSGAGFGPFDGFSKGIKDVADLFQESFRQRDATKPHPGVDVEIDLAVSLQEAFCGAQKAVQAALYRPCPDCGGEGAPKGAKRETCPDCKGTGKVATKGPLPFRKACVGCTGKGTIPIDRCRACKGRGARTVTERLKVTVPAGIDTGARLRLKGRGAAGENGGPAGDLYVRVRVTEDPRFERKDDDLWTEVRIPVSEAILGGDVEVALLSGGTARMAVPPGTQGGQVFRLKGKGFASLVKKTHGDLLVTIQLKVPTLLDAEARKMVDRLKGQLSGF